MESKTIILLGNSLLITEEMNDRLMLNVNISLKNRPTVERSSSSPSSFSPYSPNFFGKFINVYCVIIAEFSVKTSTCQKKYWIVTESLEQREDWVNKITERIYYADGPTQR